MMVVDYYTQIHMLFCLSQYAYQTCIFNRRETEV